MTDTKPTTTAKTRTVSDTKAKMVEKVRALLAKAENAGATQEEAATYSAHAAALMQKYALDAAVVRADKGQKPESVTVHNFTVSGQGWHGKARASLVYSVVEAYGAVACTMGNRMNGKDRIVVAVGTTSTLDALKILVPSVLLQAENTGVAATKAHMAEVGPTIDTPANRNIERRVFYRSYLMGYGYGVADKINAGRVELAGLVANTPGALVLVSDADRAKAAFERMFPKLGTTAVDKVSVDGYVTGKRDGAKADTGTGGKVAGKGRTAISN